MTTQSIYKSKEGEAAIMQLYDRVLAAWKHPFEKIILPTRYGNTFGIACGKPTSPALVLLHGSGSNLLTWLGDIPEYSKKYRVFALDIVGEAGKSDHNRPSWESPAYVEWLDDVLNGLGCDNAILIGLSLGGWIALKYSAAMPYRIAKLVLISPGGVCPSRFLITLRLIALTLCGKWGQNRIKQLIFGDQKITEDAEEAFQLLNKHYNYRVGDPPLVKDAELESIGIPAFFLGDMNDVFFHTEKALARLQKFLPRLSVKVSDDKGHGLINMASFILPFLSQDEI
ncbi:MAG: alpha/beta hydrolase [Spirochaetales bacterium]|nr:alpha/beta hydrolase [Spirochaetales bacterium]